MSNATVEHNHNREELDSTEFKQLLEMVRDMMGELHQEATMSVELNELNISNEWADEIKAMVNKPLKSSFEALQNIEKSILSLVHEQFMQFLESKTELIERVCLVSDNRLHYAVVLIDDSIENEAEILEFKINYDETPVARKFPMIISFPKKEQLKNAKIAQEITIG